jgi:hypothetical protein
MGPMPSNETPIPGGTGELTAEQTADLQAKANSGDRQAQRELAHRRLVDAAADLLFGRRDVNGRPIQEQQ